jgi:hypothetical protein
MSSRLGSFRFLLALACSLALTSSAIASTDEKGPPVHPFQAELVSTLEIIRIKLGERVLARVPQEYETDGCHLRAGAMLEGSVVAFTPRTKQQKASSIQVQFDHADCNNRPSAPFKFTLIALIGAEGDPHSSMSGLSEGPPLADDLARGSAMGNDNSASLMAPPSLRGGQDSSPPTLDNIQARHARQNITHINLGQVIDVPHTRLQVGAGTDGATVITSSNQDVRVEIKSVLVMLPSAAFSRPATLDASHAPIAPPALTNPTVAISTAPTPPAPKPAAPPPPEPPDETAICSRNCTALGTMSSRQTSASNISATLPIDALGYAPRQKERTHSFNHETALTYLDETHLLCTFDPHRLRIRKDESSVSAHTVRAVVINTSSHTIDRVMEWRVNGDDTYLWRLGSGQILVNTAHELRRYDSDLKPIQSVPVDGSIAWVAASPSNDHIAVAVLKHRFSETVYEQLRGLDQPADDDLEVLLYDRDLKLISATIRSSQTYPPVLSDAGELRISHLSWGRWKIVEYGWDHTAHDLITVHSACRPVLSVPEHGLTFVTGCSESKEIPTWYRMIGPDGHTLLKGESSANEVAQSADAALAGSFAVRMFRAAQPMNIDQPFNRSDLTLEEIAIYRSSNGSRLSSIATNDFVLAQNSYALSPHGDQMALAGKNAILFYELKLP